MKISACYIVKNEAAVLARSLDSVQAHVDEIIVVDTGSSDRTKEIAAACNARIFSFPWQQDFSAARNFALDKAAGDWIVFLDADEYFTPETSGNLRAVIHGQENAAVDGLLLQEANIEEQTGECLLEFFSLRIFRNQLQLRYSGRVHEQLRLIQGGAVRTVAVSPAQLRILHTGYSANLSRGKAQRNLQLLLRELEQGRDPAELYMYLAETYDGLDDREQAVRYARLDIALGRRAITYASRSYRILLRLLAQGGSPEERRQAAAGAVKDYPEIPEFHAEYAECLAADFQYEAAVQEMERALACGAQPMGLEPVLFGRDEERQGRQRLVHWQQLCARMQTLRLSACVIARDDRRDLEQWLQNVRQYADEIVYVDTGAADGSAEFMQQPGVAAYSFPWQDDFSAARNFALDKARGDWIVFTDADEYFAQPQKLRAVVASIDQEQPAMEAVMVPIANIDEDDGNREIQRFSAIRIFRALPELRYFGSVHETLQHVGGILQLLAESGGSLLYHTGYSSGRIRKKLRRNLSLLQQEIAVQGEQPCHYRYLAECYMGLGDYPRAFQYAWKAIHEGTESLGSDSDLYHMVLLAMQRLGKPLAERLSVAEQAVGSYPELPDFWAEKGLLLAQLGQSERAVPELERAVEQAEQNTVAKGIAATRFPGMADRVYYELAKAYARQGRYQKARQFAKTALQKNPRYEKALTLYAELVPADSLPAELDSFYQDRQSDLEFLLHWAAKREDRKLQEHYAALLKDEYAIEDELQPLYALQQAGDSPALYRAVIGQTAAKLPQLFCLLLRLLENENPMQRDFVLEARQMVPVAMQRLLDRYEGKLTKLQAADFDNYRALIPATAVHNESRQQARYAALAMDFLPELLRQAADAFLAQECWEIALQLYKKLLSHSMAETGEFWYCMGICFYWTRQPALAKESLQAARKLGCGAVDIEAYLAWIGDVEQHD